MNLNDFWHPDNIRPGATDSELDRAEAMLGISFPRRLRRLLGMHNGGQTQRMRFDATMPASAGTDHVVIDHVLGVRRELGETVGETMLDSPRISRERGLPPKQIVLANGERWVVTMNLRARVKAPTVHLFDLEAGAEQPLAGDFDAFVDGLEPAH
jgi:hypothetical protein